MQIWRKKRKTLPGATVSFRPLNRRLGVQEKIVNFFSRDKKLFREAESCPGVGLAVLWDALCWGTGMVQYGLSLMGSREREHDGFVRLTEVLELNS